MNSKCRVPIQSLIDHIKTASDVDPWAKEMAEELLKKQEPVDIEIEGGGSSWWNVCGECHGTVDDSDSYCRHCGRPFRKKVHNGMHDKENVITHLQIIHTWAEFARERDLQFFTPKHLEDIAQWSDDAITLLKEQGKSGCDGCEYKYGEDCPLSLGSDGNYYKLRDCTNYVCPNGKLNI